MTTPTCIDAKPLNSNSLLKDILEGRALNTHQHPYIIQAIFKSSMATTLLHYKLTMVITLIPHHPSNSINQTIVTNIITRQINHCNNNYYQMNSVSWGNSQKTYAQLHFDFISDKSTNENSWNYLPTHHYPQTWSHNDNLCNQEELHQVSPQ